MFTFLAYPVPRPAKVMLHATRGQLLTDHVIVSCTPRQLYPPLGAAVKAAIAGGGGGGLVGFVGSVPYQMCHSLPLPELDVAKTSRRFEPQEVALNAARGSGGVARVSPVPQLEPSHHWCHSPLSAFNAKTSIRLDPHDTARGVPVRPKGGAPSISQSGAQCWPSNQ